jgi:hypothetical protein
MSEKSHTSPDLEPQPDQLLGQTEITEEPQATTPRTENEETPTERCTRMLREEAERARSRGLGLCFRTHGSSPGKGSCSTDEIIGKTDEEIREWMEEGGINPERVKEHWDLFWYN